MDNDNTVDVVKIEVEGEDKSATSTLDKVVSKLERIKNAGSSGGTKDIGSRVVSSGSVSKLDKFRQKLTEIRSNVNKWFSGQPLSSSQLSKLNSQADQSMTKIQELKSKIQEMQNSFSDKPTATMQMLIDKENELEAAAKRVKAQITNTTPQTLVEKYTQQYDNLRSQIEQISNRQLDLEDNGRAFLTVAQQQPEAFEQLNEQLNREEKRFAEINDKIKSGTSNAKAFGKEVRNAFSDSVVGKFTGKIKQFASSIKRIVLYRTIRSLINQVTSGFKSGINNLYQYSQSIQGNFASSMDRATSSFLTLKNSIAAAAAPLIEYFIPYIEKAVDKLVDFNNWIAKVFAKLSGKSTYTKAVKVSTTYAEAAGLATENTNKLRDSVDRLTRSFAGLDEITVIGENLSDATSSITGASNNSLDPSLMFVEESTTGIWEDIKNKISEIWDGIVSDIKKKALLAYIGVLVTWGKIKGWFVENVINPIKTNCLLAYLWFNEHVITPVKNAFTGLWDSITEKAKLAWLGIQIVWAKVSGWFDENLVAPIRELFEKGLWNYIEDKALLAYIGVQIVWGKAKGWFNDNFVKPVSDIFEKGLWNTVTEKSRLAWLGVQLVWGKSAVGWFDNNFIKPFREISEKGLWGYIEEKAKLACLGVKITIANTVNWIIDRIEKAINGMVIGVNWIIDKYNQMGYGFSTVTGASFYYIQEIQPITLNRVQAYKDGGFPEDGFFYANHNELVGQFSNGRTAVANNEQIVEGISNGVSQANEETNSLLRENNRLMRQLLSKDSTIDVSTIASAFNRQNRRDGKVTVPVSV